MTKQPSLLLALSVVLGACTTNGDDDITDIEISATDPTGKADAIDGKQLRVRTHVRLSPWFPYEDHFRELADLGRWKTVEIDAATDQTVVATGTFFAFQGTDQVHALQHSHWLADGLLSLSVEKAAADAHRLGFLVWDKNYLPAPYVCARGELRMNYFEQLVINLRDREVYADGKHTFTFAECGIDPDGRRAQAVAGPDRGVPRWNFEVFVLPLATAGRLEGTYEYRLRAELL